MRYTYLKFVNTECEDGILRAKNTTKWYVYCAGLVQYIQKNWMDLSGDEHLRFETSGLLVEIPIANLALVKFKKCDFVQFYVPEEGETFKAFEEFFCDIPIYWNTHYVEWYPFLTISEVK